MTELQSFELRGLHGYKSLKIDFTGRASIVLAENGVGKTTLLNVLYALLSGRFARLSTVDFTEAIICINHKELPFRKDQAFKDVSRIEASSILENRTARELAEYGLTSTQLIELSAAYIEGGRVRVEQSPLFRTVHISSPWSADEIFQKLDAIKSLTYVTEYTSAYLAALRSELGQIQVLYLPTYRRIEANFEDLIAARPQVRRRPTSAIADFSVDRDELIFFGLTDVEERLDATTRFIQKSMFESYSKLSGKLIDALLGSTQPELDLARSLDADAIRLMLGRLGRSAGDTSYILQKAINPNTYSDEKGNFLLAFFLRELLISYEASRPHEVAVESFVETVNEYISLGGSPEKEMRFDKVKLSVDIWHRALGRSVPLGSLSSGEKQIVSVFARLLLTFGKRYLILIDEPELSLSIEWQRRFLLDILKAPSCHQLLAITHSPFVFENELDSSARSLQVTMERLPHG